MQHKYASTNCTDRIIQMFVIEKEYMIYWYDLSSIRKYLVCHWYIVYMNHEYISYYVHKMFVNLTNNLVVETSITLVSEMYASLIWILTRSNT